MKKYLVEVTPITGDKANEIASEIKMQEATAKFAFGRQVFIVRHEKNLTQEDLAQLCGVTQERISQLENGVAVSVDLKNKVRDALEMEETGGSTV